MKFHLKISNFSHIIRPRPPQGTIKLHIIQRSTKLTTQGKIGADQIFWDQIGNQFFSFRQWHPSSAPELWMLDVLQSTIRSLQCLQEALLNLSKSAAKFSKNKRSWIQSLETKICVRITQLLHRLYYCGSYITTK